MLRIRQKQRETLDAHAFSSFLRVACEHVAALGAPCFDDHSDAARDRWVEGQVEHAIGLAIDDQRAILCWLELVAVHGEALAEDAYVLELISSPEAIERWPTTLAQIEAFAAADRGESTESAETTEA